MNLTAYDMTVLATFHGNTREARMVRADLLEDDLKYCPICDTVKSLDEFNNNPHIISLSGKQGRCRTCQRKPGGGKAPYTPVTPNRTDCETTARRLLVSA